MFCLPVGFVKLQDGGFFARNRRFKSLGCWHTVHFIQKLGKLLRPRRPLIKLTGCTQWPFQYVLLKTNYRVTNVIRTLKKTSFIWALSIGFAVSVQIKVVFIAGFNMCWLPYKIVCLDNQLTGYNNHQKKVCIWSHQNAYKCICNCKLVPEI